MEFDATPLFISAKTAVVSTIICFFLGVAVAWFITKKSGWIKGFLDAVFTLPMILPPTVLGFFLLLIFGRKGPIGSFLYKMGISIIFSWPATVIAAAVVAFPLMYKTTRGAFEQIDNNLLNAARTLGVSEWKIFWTIAIPLAWPGVAAGTVLAFTRALGEFGATLMIAGNIPGKTQTIPIAIFFAVEGGDNDKALLWVLIISVISTIIILLTNYWTNRQQKILWSGGKGK